MGGWNHIAIKCDLGASAGIERNAFVQLNGVVAGFQQGWASGQNSQCALLAGSTAFQVGNAYGNWSRNGFPGKIDSIALECSCEGKSLSVIHNISEASVLMMSPSPLPTIFRFL